MSSRYNFKQIGNAHVMYLDDNEGYYYMYYMASKENQKSSAAHGLSYFGGKDSLGRLGAVGLYLGYNELVDSGYSIGKITKAGKRSSIICPSYYPPQSIITDGYGNAFGYSTCNSSRSSSTRALHTSNLQLPSGSLLWGEKYQSGEVLDPRFNGKHLIDYRHIGNKANVLFHDMHVEPVKPNAVTGPQASLDPDAPYGSEWNRFWCCYSPDVPNKPY